MNFVLWNESKSYEPEIKNISLLKNSEVKLKLISCVQKEYENLNLNSLFEILRNKESQVDALIRRDEHTCLWGDFDKWKVFANNCRSINIKTLYYDYGYFCHYDTYISDIWTKNYQSSIYIDWPNIKNEVDWASAPDYIQAYRNNFLKTLEKEKNSSPVLDLAAQKYAVIWPQFSVDLLRRELKFKDGKKLDITSWINIICEYIEQAGLQPVIKFGKYIDKVQIEKINCRHMLTNSESDAKKNNIIYLKDDLNTNIIAHSKFNVINCSSVSNQLVLANCPIVATGKSWFTGLDVFNEPKRWDLIFENVENINLSNRNKWCNWWIKKQDLRKNILTKTIETYKNYKDYE